MKRNFTDFISAYSDYTRGQETSAKIHKWVAISVIAGAIGRKVWIDRGYYTLFPNLYVFVIGASGLVKKSTSTGIGVDLLRSLPEFNLMSERMTAASLITQLERSHKFFEHGGKKLQQSSVYAYASELSVFLGEVYGSTSELLTTFYDCSPHDSSKPWVYENKSEGQVKIYGPCLNILGASTPTWLVRCIPHSEMEGGFSSRVIFVVETEPPKRFVAWPEVSLDAAAIKPKLLADLASIHGLIGPANVTDEARSFFAAWYESHQRGLLSNKDPRFNGYFGRKPDTVLKLSLISSVSESDDMTVTKEHIVRGIELLEELEESMFAAFGASGKSEYSEDLHKVWNVLKASKEVSHSQIMRSNWRDIGHKKLIDIMEDLLRMNLINKPIAMNGDVVYSAKAESLLR